MSHCSIIFHGQSYPISLCSVVQSLNRQGLLALASALSRRRGCHGHPSRGPQGSLVIRFSWYVAWFLSSHLRLKWHQWPWTGWFFGTGFRLVGWALIRYWAILRYIDEHGCGKRQISVRKATRGVPSCWFWKSLTQFWGYQMWNFHIQQTTIIRWAHLHRWKSYHKLPGHGTSRGSSHGLWL